MKRGIQRSVNTARQERSTGDAPTLGRIARMPKVGGSNARRRRHGSRRGGKRTPTRFLSIGLVALTLMLLGAALSMWLLPNIQRKSARAGDGKEANSATRVASKFPSPSEDQAIAKVKEALSVRNEERVGEVFFPGSSTPAEVVGFLKRLPRSKETPVRYEWLGSMDANNLQLDGVLVTTAEVGKSARRIAFLTPDEQGVWKVDFDSFARTVHPSWETLAKTSTAGGTVRVFTTTDSYHNGPFSNDKVWVCYGMKSPDTEHFFSGYCRVGSAQAAALASLLPQGGAPARVTLELRRVEGGAANQFEIARVLAEDWVVGPTPYDELFE